jgi:hypothetical protein
MFIAKIEMLDGLVTPTVGNFTVQQIKISAAKVAVDIVDEYALFFKS